MSNRSFLNCFIIIIILGTIYIIFITVINELPRLIKTINRVGVSIFGHYNESVGTLDFTLFEILNGPYVCFRRQKVRTIKNDEE